MTKIQHENVVKLFEVHETPQTLFLVMEILTGGELFDRIIAKGHYSEADARKLAITILKAVQHLHENGVAHRDLKPENILIVKSPPPPPNGPPPPPVVKIADFGLAKLTGDLKATTLCGTPQYLSPEIVSSQGHTFSADWWALGILVLVFIVLRLRTCVSVCEAKGRSRPRKACTRRIVDGVSAKRSSQTSSVTAQASAPRLPQASPPGWRQWTKTKARMRMRARANAFSRPTR